MNSYKNCVIFVPACLLCPVFMANKTKPIGSWRSEIISFLNEKGYSIIQMPCPEVTFPDLNCGITRSPHGIKYYEELDGFTQHCMQLGDSVIKQIDVLLDHGYTISAIMGIEHSPTCAVNYIYTNKGTQRRQGLLIHHLTELIERRNYQIPIIGINRRYPNKAIESLL